MKISRLLVFLAVALGFGFATPSWAGRFPGGKGRADCYSEFEVTNVATAKTVDCTDGTACDADGACDGTCTIDVALCLNQTDANDPKCTPHPPLTSVTVDTGQPLNVPDLSSTPFRLIGGRVVYWRGNPAAYLLISKASHRISVFVFRDDMAPRNLGEVPATITATAWHTNGLTFVAVAQVPAQDLQQLRSAFVSGP